MQTRVPAVAQAQPGRGGRTPKPAPGVDAEPGRRGMPAVSRRLRTILVMTITGVAILAAAALTNNRPAAAGGLTPVDLAGIPTGPAPIVGQPAPDFVATDVDGKQVRVSDLRGKVVWLTFGASWCQPCRAENPDIKATSEAFRDRGVVVLQVYINQDQASVIDYASRVGLAYTKIADSDDQIATNYRILGIPAHFFIDRDGILRELKVGTLDAATMQSILTELAG
jgi:cytochrome c biogenesis protein CcmG/thiol:disulfide interchange protein DsbE